MAKAGEELPKVDLRSEDIAESRRQELLRIFPEAHTESGGINFEALRLSLGDAVQSGLEGFGMSWPGKAECAKTILRQSVATLLPVEEESVNWDTTQNVIIEGDNLEVLKILQKAYLGKIGLIYIDPPYNTGKDFVYPDNYSESLKTYLQYTKQVNDDGKLFSTNTEATGRFHSKWMNMIYPRLSLARNLMSNDGLICVSIDDSEIDNLKKLLDEVFGESNFMATLAVEMSKTQGMKVAAAQNGAIVKNHEYMIIYARDIGEGTKNRMPLYDSSELYDNHYDIIWDGESNTTTLVQALLDDSISSDLFQRYGLSISKTNLKKVLTLEDDYYSHFISKIAPSLYRESPIALGNVQSLDLPEGEVVRYKTYILRKNSKGTVIQLQAFLDGVHQSDDYRPVFARSTIRGALWKGFYSDMMNVGKEGGVEFKNGKKPVRLVQQLIKYANRKDGLILDFFAGSGTTGEAVMAQNENDGGSRRFMLVQLPEPTPDSEVGGFSSIADITRTRIRNAASRFLTNPNLIHDQSIDLGFRSFHLEESNFAIWDANAIEGDESKLEQQLFAQVEHVLPGRTNQDILFELMLKSRYELTTPVEQVKVGKCEVWKVAGGELVAIIDSGLTIEVIREVANWKPVSVVILDRCFGADDSLKANARKIFEDSSVDLKTV